MNRQVVCLICIVAWMSALGAVMFAQERRSLSSLSQWSATDPVIVLPGIVDDEGSDESG